MFINLFSSINWVLMGANLSVSLLFIARSTPIKIVATSATYKMKLSFSFISPKIRLKPPPLGGQIYL